MKRKIENAIIFAGLDETDITHVKRSKEYVFGNSNNTKLPTRTYNKVILKSSDGSGRNLIGYVSEITEYTHSDYWESVRCSKSREWKGIVRFDKIDEVSDETLNLISDTMQPVVKSNGTIGYRGRMSGGSFGYCNASFQNAGQMK